MQQLAGAEVGARIAQARKEAGAMTQEQLADLLDVSKRSIQEYEAGNVIPWKHFNRLVEVFPTRTMGWFLHGEDATPRAANESDVDDRLDAIEGRLGRVEDLARDVLDEIQQLRAERQEKPKRAARSG